MVFGTTTLENLFERGVHNPPPFPPSPSKKEENSYKTEKQICAANTTKIIFLD